MVRRTRGGFTLIELLVVIAPFGGALPMRFCRPDGRLIDVYQQHGHCMDDLHFGPRQDYSYKLSPEAFAPMLRRIYTDITTRFHTPCAVCIHPSNWVAFSRPQGQMLVTMAREFGMAIWSFDQWVAFLDARRECRVADLQWDGNEVSFRVAVGCAHGSLRVALQGAFGGRSICDVSVNGEAALWEEVVRHGVARALIELPAGGGSVRARYG